MSDQDKILQFMHNAAPTTPTKVAKFMGTEIIIASAHLSDLSARGLVKISKLKIGGSPLYYLPGQEEKLYDFAQGNVNPKDLDVLNRLKTEKVLRESELDLLARVALRGLKDFAVPLHVDYKGGTELFWKWHLLNKEELNQKLNQILVGEEEVIPPAPAVAPQTVSVTTTVKAPETQVLPEKVQTVSEPEPLKEEQKKLVESEQKKKTLVQKVKEKIKRKPRSEVAEEFPPLVESFFKELEIKIEQKEIIRKNAETNYLLQVPSVIGKINYFCKSKAKAKCDEKDLSAAYMEARAKKLPLLFLYSQELTKKAEEMLETGAFENTIVRKVE